MCKIVAPPGWLPNSQRFEKLVNHKTFVFDTKIQRLSQLQTRSLFQEDFFRDIEQVSKETGGPGFSGTVVEQQILPPLYVAVKSFGGFDAVCSGKLWSEVAVAVRFPPVPLRETGDPLRSYYEKHLLALERRKKALLETKIEDGWLICCSIFPTLFSQTCEWRRRPEPRKVLWLFPWEDVHVSRLS